jgi:cytochrome oxidase Cu insertion factor (SCO1/SenC/PrrC family)
MSFSNEDEHMHLASIAVTVLAGALLLPLVAWARDPVDLAKLGPQVGQPAPDFNLKDQHGKTWTRDSLLGPNGAMLVFYRSADW